MADLTIKAGDTWPPISGTATDVDGPVDLTAADSVMLIIKHSTGTPLIEYTLIDVNADGTWTKDWEADDTDTLGTYDVELEVTWDAGATPPAIQTFPNDTFMSIDIVDDLGGDA